MGWKTDLLTKDLIQREVVFKLQNRKNRQQNNLGEFKGKCNCSFLHTISYNEVHVLLFSSYAPQIWLGLNSYTKYVGI